MSPRARTVLRLASWMLATVVAVLLVLSVNLSATRLLLRGADARWIAVALLFNLSILGLWTEQWRALMPPGSAVSFRRMLTLIGTTSLVGNTTPASGQVSAVVLLANEPNVSRNVAVSVLALDQLIEGFTKLVLVGIAATLVPLPSWMRPTLFVLALSMTALVVGLALFSSQSRWFQPYVEALKSLRDTRRIAVSIAWCVLSKLSEGVAIVAVQLAFGVEVQMSTTILVLAAVHLGTMLPLAPANIGTYEASVMTAYRQSGLPAEMALGLAITQHVCLLVSTAGVGYVLFVLRDKVRGGAVSAG